SLQYLIASLGGGFSLPGWMIYAQHPIWTAVTIAGAGVEAVSAYARENTCHARLTYPDRMPAEVWYGRPDMAAQYCPPPVSCRLRGEATGRCAGGRARPDEGDRERGGSPGLAGVAGGGALAARPSGPGRRAGVAAPHRGAGPQDRGRRAPRTRPRPPRRAGAG